MKLKTTILKAMCEHDDPAIKAWGEQLVDVAASELETLQTIASVISQLKMDVKYLIFDLEATRRERDELRAGQ